MPQTLLCVVGVVAYVATLCVTLTYGYLALGRAYEADMTSHHDRVVPVPVAEAESDETFAEAASTARFRSVGVGLIHFGDPYQDGDPHQDLVPSPFSPVEAPADATDVAARPRDDGEVAWRPRLLNPRAC